MTNKEEFDCFTDGLLDNAVRDFKATEQYAFINEKLEQMERDCEVNFAEDERGFAEECFDLLADIYGQEESYVYRHGLHDCVAILKELRVLA